jgi:hypothetical protein
LFSNQLQCEYKNKHLILITIFFFCAAKKIHKPRAGKDHEAKINKINHTAADYILHLGMLKMLYELARNVITTDHSTKMIFFFVIGALHEE